MGTCSSSYPALNSAAMPVPDRASKARAAAERASAFVSTRLRVRREKMAVLKP